MSRGKFAQLLTILCAILFFVCTTTTTKIETDMPTRPLRFLALGDSYTIGEGVDPSLPWPVQLVDEMQASGKSFEAPIIIAQTGWTTGDLLAAIEANPPQGSFDLVTLLIGVNNQYQGKDIESYREEFDTLLMMAIDFAGGDPTRVVVLSIPDWSVTPFAEGRNRDQISKAIDQFNTVNRENSLAAGVHYIDVTPISRQTASDTSLLAPDRLHPSEKMYAAWVDLMVPVINKILISKD